MLVIFSPVGTAFLRGAVQPEDITRRNLVLGAQDRPSSMPSQVAISVTPALSAFFFSVSTFWKYLNIFT